ncbi:DUF2848 family protein [Lysinibacillus capsici]|uniref:DUF2848 family protein n=1 Tax=Lysinibacillus capsici TaxID=2115968 RepID=UPI000E209A3C|nr:DUF2848 family protein [Lysinibacillus capsici]MED3873371.1 DUF2848 family protein [Lysinibacillus capsici]RDV32100.1 hypothetical protein C7B89_10290 [Lysinibacillus capsici]WPK03450.1 DUF2848 family protein [Lysinibacillus capsici]
MNIIVSGKKMEATPKRLLIAGYTGKDQASVKKHIDELREIGVPAPPQVPMIYDVSTNLLTTSPSISVVQESSSGEAEVVIMNVKGKWYVGLGSDHTDRELEKLSIQKSKQVCSKPISTQFWLLDDIESRWDDIEMRSWMIVNGEKKEYQTGTLGEFLHPKELIKIITERGYYSEDLMVFCGTLPIVTGEFIYGDGFSAELYDALTDRKIQLDYKVHILTDAEVV